MKNSNRYKDIFSSKESLSRSDIHSYAGKLTDEEKNLIEQKELNDSFDQEAMEGWETLSHDTTILTDIESKLFKRKSFNWSLTAGSIIIGILSVYIFQFFTSNSEVGNQILTTELSEAEPIKLEDLTIESADVIIPETIQKMSVVPVDKQLKIQEIKDDFANMEMVFIELPAIEISEIEKTDQQHTQLISSRSQAKEIYLHDLKLIDYSLYREKPVVHTKQLILTGTPANMENENSENFDASWTVIDVPYMNYLNKSIYYFNKGKYKKALARFETITESYPLDVNANFYGGLCLYNFGE